MDFGENAGHVQYGEIAFVCAVLGHFEQRGFTDPGFAADNKRRSTLIDPVEQMVDEGDARLSTLQG
jgi:hypothetical protein